jgi:hypothetical protein
MGGNNFNQETRLAERRKVADRRKNARFSDEFGRRLGVERRLPIKDTKPASNELYH